MEYKNPKNWYIRLNEDFFKRTDIKIIKSMENGTDFVMLLWELRLLTINTNGKLEYKEGKPYGIKMLSSVLDVKVEILEKGIEVFKDFNLVRELEDGTLYMEEVEGLIGYTSKEAERKALYRQKKKEETEKEEEDVGQLQGQKLGQCLAIDRDKSIDNIVNSNSNSLEEEKKKNEAEQNAKKKELEKKYLSMFEDFWEEYPKKESKAKALEAFIKIKPNEELLNTIKEKISLFKKTSQWSNKQYIPLPATWLNQRRWEDELTEENVIGDQLNTSPAMRAMLRRKNNE